MSEMLYLQTERNIKITSPVVTLGDVAQLSSTFSISVLSLHRIEAPIFSAASRRNTKFGTSLKNTGI